MNELQVNVTQKPGAVQWNFEELVNALQAQMQQYEAMVYTEDTVKDAKADVAALRKLRSEVESRRKEIRNKCPVCQEMCNWPISHQKGLQTIILLNPPTDWQRST